MAKPAYASDLKSDGCYSYPGPNPGIRIAWLFYGGIKMNITLYKFTKRRNSTMVISPNPTTNSPLNVDGTFNYACDLDTIELRITVPAENQNRIFDYNYCILWGYRRWYYIDRWGFDNGFAIAYCKIDLFATFRLHILNSYVMLSRMSYLYSNSTYGTLLNDSLYPASPIIDTRRVTYTANNMFSAKPSEGVFIISVLSTDAPCYGAVNYYVLSAAQFAVLVSNMVANSSTEAGSWKNTDLSSQMLKSVVSPIQYITSCRWLPIKIVSTIYTTVSNIKLGPWSSGAAGARITDSAVPEVSAYGKLVIPDIPAENQNNMVCYGYPPYATYTLFNSLFGTIEIDGNAINSVRQICSSVSPAIEPYLDMRMKANVITGTCIFRLYAPTSPRTISGTEPDDFNLLFQIEQNVSADIPLAEISTNYVQMAKSAVNTVSGITSAVGAAFSKDAFGAVNGVANAVNSGIDVLKYAVAPEVKSNSAAGGKGFYSTIDKFELQGTYYRTVRTDYKQTGRAVSFNGNVHDVVFPESATSLTALTPAYLLPSYIELPMMLKASDVFPSGINLDGLPVMTLAEKNELTTMILENGVFCE